MKLTKEEMVKWLCLFECLHEIGKYCDKKELDVEDILASKAKVNHIRNYIQDRSETMSTDLELGRLNDFTHDFIYG